MKILITGANGFVGRLLAQHLHTTHPTATLILTDIQAPPSPSPTTISLATDLTSPTACTSLITTHRPTVIYLLHGMMSSGSEAHLDLGLTVNFDSIRTLLDVVRTHQPGGSTKVIFTSSCAVYGRRAVTHLASEIDVVPMPESSYGTQKLMIEMLVNDYSRRGLIDGRSVRLPTVFVRAGTPTAAASSFVSGIVREPLHGVEAVLPVDPQIGIWLTSPRTLAVNLKRAMEVEAEQLGYFRQVLLPGFTASSGEILEALEKVAGREVRARVREERDEVIQRIVKSWPERYDTSRAKELGFVEDVGLEQTIKDFMEGEGLSAKA